MRILTIIGLALLLSGCSNNGSLPALPLSSLTPTVADQAAKGPCLPFALSTTARKWTSGLSASPAFYNVGTALAANFTFDRTADLGYAYTSSPCAALTGTLTLNISQVGAGHLVPWEAGDPGPVMVRPLLWAYSLGNFDINHPEYRWWSTQGIVLGAPGSYSLSIPLVEGQWSNVNGQTIGFAAAATGHIVGVGWTVGTAQFFGHGAYVDNGVATSLQMTSEGVQ